MKALSEEYGHIVDYIEVEGGEHCLVNCPNKMDVITSWLDRIDSSS